MDGALLQTLQHLHGEGDHQRNEAVGLARRVGGHPHQLGGDLVQRQAGKGGVEKGVQKLELSLRQVGGQAHQPVAYHIGVGHDHNDEGVAVHHQQVEAPNGDPVAPGGQGKGGVAGELGNDPPGLIDDLVQLPHFHVQRLIESLGLLR